jgi:hypothetical protein
MIKQAAIRKGSKVFVGSSHADIIQKNRGDLDTFGMFKNEYIQGFITTNGKFLDSAEAAQDAYKSGQIPQAKVYLLMDKFCR